MVKVIRYKKIRKILAHYSRHHAITPPYRILMDAEFIQAARDGRIMIKEQFPKLFQAETEAFITPCVDEFIRLQGENMGAVAFISRSLGRFDCGHREPLKVSDCLISLLKQGNSHHFIAGIQNPILRQFVRSQFGIPLLFIRQSIPVLEKPIFAQKLLVQQREMKELGNFLQPKEIEALKLLKGESSNHQNNNDLHHNPSSSSLSIVHKKRRVHGPNPLSIKKKQKPNPQQNNRKPSKPAPSAASSQSTQEIVSNTQANSSESSAPPLKSSKGENSLKIPSTPIVREEKKGENTGEDEEGGKRKRRRSRKRKRVEENSSNPSGEAENSEG